VLQRYFGEARAKHVVLLDEAHNLVDRSRDVYSASLAVDDLTVATERRENKTTGKARRLRDRRNRRRLGCGVAQADCDTQAPLDRLGGRS
jgi:hypothetical protein